MTTDEIDQITPEERASLIGFCRECGEWVKFNAKAERAECRNCRKSLDVRTIQTQRTFNPTRKVPKSVRK